jgi:hypothetical protein
MENKSRRRGRQVCAARIYFIYQSQQQNLTGGTYFGAPGIKGKIILKRILKKQGVD